MTTAVATRPARPRTGNGGAPARRAVVRWAWRMYRREWRRQALILVEWKSRAHFDSYRDDPELADLHPHREAGAGAYVWHLFDCLEDLRPLLRD